MSNAQYKPGDIVIADIRNGIENPQAKGKGRPALIVGRKGGSYLALGFTTKDSYRNGEKRVRCPGHREMGLRGNRSFIWSFRLSRVSGLDVSHKIGRVNDKLLELIATNAKWSELSVAAFLASVATSL